MERKNNYERVCKDHGAVKLGAISEIFSHPFLPESLFHSKFNNHRNNHNKLEAILPLSMIFLPHITPLGFL